MTAEVADDNAFEEARRKINAIDEPVEWYFTLAAETPVAVAPGDTGTPVAKPWTIAMPLIGFYPPEREGAPPSPPTHYDVLLPIHEQGFAFARVNERLSKRTGLALPDFDDYRTVHGKAGFSRLL